MSGSALSVVSRPPPRERGRPCGFAAGRSGHVRFRRQLLCRSFAVEDVRGQDNVAPVGDVLRHVVDAGAQAEGVHVEQDARERTRAGGRAGDDGFGNAFCGRDLDEHPVRISEDDGGRRLFDDGAPAGAPTAPGGAAQA